MFNLPRGERIAPSDRDPGTIQDHRQSTPCRYTVSDRERSACSNWRRPVRDRVSWKDSQKEKFSQMI